MVQAADADSNLVPENSDSQSPLLTVSTLYIQQSSEIIFVHCDANGKIIETNKGFRKKFRYQQDISPSTLFSYLTFSSANKVSFAIGTNNTLGYPELLCDTQTQHQYLFSVYQRNNEFFLFGLNSEFIKSKETELLSSLTTDMGNLLREGSRANRKLLEAYEKIEKLSQTDALTAMLNHGYFMERGEEILSRAKRHNRPVCLIMSDIDHFKKVNDEFGHQIGDKVLAGVGKLLNSSTRAGDISARYGGEEFVTLLQDSTLKQAVVFAERIRKTFEASCPVGPENPITISLGVASFEANDTLDSLVKKADDALYEAKRTGRNKTCVANL